MFVVKCRGDEYKFEASLDELTLKRFIGFMDNVESKKPESLKKFEQAKTEEERSKVLQSLDVAEITDKWTDFYLIFVQYFTGIPTDLLPFISREDISLVYKVINALLTQYTPKERENFTFKGEKYYFPPSPENPFIKGKDYMKGAPVYQIIEALQFDKYSANLGSKDWGALPYIISVLCKKKDETIPLKSSDREKWITDRAKEFESLPVAYALDVAFFLSIPKQGLELYSNPFLLLRELYEVKSRRIFGKFMVGI